MKCVVPNCLNFSTKTNKKKVSFHPFPNDASRRSAWTEALGLNDSDITKSSVVCTDHFHINSFYREDSREVLKDDAIPELLVCRICLATNIKFFDINDNMNSSYTQLTAPHDYVDDRLPQRLCWECAHKLRLYQQFRTQAMTSRDLLLSVIGSNQCLTTKTLISIDRKLHLLASNLSQTVPQIDISIPPVPKIEAFKKEIKKENASINNENDSKYEVIINDDDSDSDSECEVKCDFDTSIGDSCDSDTNMDETSDADTKINVKCEVVDNDNDDALNDGDGDQAIVINQTRQRDAKAKVKKSKVKVRQKKKTKDSYAKEKKSISSDKQKVIKPKRLKRKKIVINTNLFNIQPLSHEDQIREVKEREESSAYKSAMYKCTVCFKGFNIEKLYDAHIVRHCEIRSGPHECPICKARFKAVLSLRRHLTALHKEKYFCKKCPFTARCRNRASEHEKWHSGSRFQCPRCDLEFDKYTTCMGHLRMKHASDFVCSLCGFTFVSKRGVEIHVQKKHRVADISKVPLEGPYCSVCDIKFINDEAHERHLKLSSKHTSEHDPDRIRNDPQAATSRPPENLPITCDQCGEEFRGRRSLAQHLRIAHPDPHRVKRIAPKPIVCEVCGKFFQNTNILKEHMWVHTGVKLHKCPHCDVSLSTKVNLMNHMKAHDEKRESFPCRVCGKTFWHAYNRKRHMLVHTGVKKHQCTVCDKSFFTTDELKQHFSHVHLKEPWPKRDRQRCSKNSSIVDEK